MASEEMKQLAKRATSLRRWPLPKSCTANATNVAEAGFYHPARTGQDYVVCFACGKSMEGWEETDCPLSEHRRGAPGCRFLKMFSLATRLQTFTNWALASPSPAEMAAVGFVHKGAEEGTDYVECFMCGIGLDGWEAGDDPLAEHKKRSKACPYVTRPGQCDIADDAPAAAHAHAHAHATSSKATAAATAPAATREDAADAEGADAAAPARSKPVAKGKGRGKRPAADTDDADEDKPAKKRATPAREEPVVSTAAADVTQPQPQQQPAAARGGRRRGTMLATTSTATTTMAPTAAEAVAPAPARTIRRGTLAVITASASVPAAAETTLAVPAVKASRTGTLAQQQQQQSEAPAQATTLAPAPAPARATRRGTLLRTQETDASDAAPQPRAGNRRGSVLKTTAPAETVQGTTRKGTRRGTMSRQQQQTQQPSSVADAAPAGLARAVSAVRRVTAAAGAEKEATSSSSSSGAQTQGKVATPAPALDLNMTVEQFLTQQCELYIELLHQETETAIAQFKDAAQQQRARALGAEGSA